MGDLTREEMRDEVKANLGRLNIASDDIIDARYDRNLHLAQLRISRAHNWSELRKYIFDTVAVAGVVAADRFYAVPTTSGVIQDIHTILVTYDSETKPPLIRVPSRQWNVFVPSAEEGAVGRPTHYSQWDSRLLVLWKIPEENYTMLLLVTLLPTDFADDDTASDLSGKDDLIISLTTSTIMRQLGKSEAAGEYYGIYRAMLKEAIEDDAFVPDMSYISRGVGDGTSDGWPRTNYWADPFVRGM